MYQPQFPSQMSHSTLSSGIKQQHVSSPQSWSLTPSPPHFQHSRHSPITPSLASRSSKYSCSVISVSGLLTIQSSATPSACGLGSPALRVMCLSGVQPGTVEQFFQSVPRHMDRTSKPCNKGTGTFSPLPASGRRGRLALRASQSRHRHPVSRSRVSGPAP